MPDDAVARWRVRKAVEPPYRSMAVAVAVRTRPVQSGLGRERRRIYSSLPSRCRFAAHQGFLSSIAPIGSSREPAVRTKDPVAWNGKLQGIPGTRIADGPNSTRRSHGDRHLGERRCRAERHRQYMFPDLSLEGSTAYVQGKCEVGVWTFDVVGNSLRPGLHGCRRVTQLCLGKATMQLIDQGLLVTLLLHDDGNQSAVFRRDQ